MGDQQRIVAAGEAVLERYMERVTVMNDHLRLGRALKAFDNFVQNYIDPSLHAHFADNDNNAAERVRQAIRDASASLSTTHLPQGR